MKIALFAGQPATIARLFIARHRTVLANAGVQISLLVVDENASKQKSFFGHAWKICRRQARISNCSNLTSLLRIVAYKAAMRGSAPSGNNWINSDSGVDELLVPTLNSQSVINAVRQHGCDLVCLMGTRILTRNTLNHLKIPVINIHSSDPAFVRGGPPVFWEILANRDSIVLTVHEVLPELDAGHILMQKKEMIQYCGSLGKTIVRTMQAAEPHVTDLFRNVILNMKNGRSQHIPNSKGPLRVTPSVRDTLKAIRICRRRPVVPSESSRLIEKANG